MSNFRCFGQTWCFLRPAFFLDSQRASSYHLAETNWCQTSSTYEIQGPIQSHHWLKSLVMFYTFHSPRMVWWSHVTNTLDFWSCEPCVTTLVCTWSPNIYIYMYACWPIPFCQPTRLSDFCWVFRNPWPPGFVTLLPGRHHVVQITTSLQSIGAVAVHIRLCLSIRMK